LTKSYIGFRLHERWLKWFLKSMERKEVPLNSDFRPLGVFFHLSYWNPLFSPYLTTVFKWFEGWSLPLTLALTTIFTLFLSILFVKAPETSIYSLPYAICHIHLRFCRHDARPCHPLYLFTFQTLYGYLYYQIGLSITVFMMGIAFSSYLITRRLERIRKDSSLFLKTELMIVSFSLLLPFVLSIPTVTLEKPPVYFLLYMTFLAMSFHRGFLVGLQFPLATKIYLRSSSKEGILGQTAGLLYEADLFGGFFGGLFGGILLLPILGLKESCFMMAMIKGSSFILFLLFTKIRKWSPTGKARGTSMFFSGIRRSIPSYGQGFGGLSSSHSSTAIGRGLLRRRIK
jgi:spermidine synthase